MISAPWYYLRSIDAIRIELLIRVRLNRCKMEGTLNFYWSKETENANDRIATGGAGPEMWYQKCILWCCAFTSDGGYPTGGQGRRKVASNECGNAIAKRR